MMHKKLPERNRKITDALQNGAKVTDLAQEHGLSPQTVYHIAQAEMEKRRKVTFTEWKDNRKVPLLFRPESATKNLVTVASPAVSKNATMKSSRNTKTASTPKTSLRHTIIPCRVFTVLFGASVSRNVKEIESSAECCRGLFFL